MKVLTVYWSRYGHTLQLARAVHEGVASVEGIEPVLRRAQEFSGDEEEIAKSEHASNTWEQQKDTPVCTVQDLREARGVVFGSPTRYGNMAAQMKRLIDSTASLWVKGEMEGKPAGVFTSTASTHGGQETTCLTMMVPLLHLGMVIAGVPYSTPGMIHTEARGGTPYGATTIVGAKGELSPCPEDLEIARTLGRRVADLTRKIFG